MDEKISAKKTKEIKQMEEKVLGIEDREMELEGLVKRIEEKTMQKAKQHINKLVEQSVLPLFKKKAHNPQFTPNSKKLLAGWLKPIDESKPEYSHEKEIRDNVGKEEKNAVKLEEANDAQDEIEAKNVTEIRQESAKIEKKPIKDSRRSLKSKLDAKIQELTKKPEEKQEIHIMPYKQAQDVSPQNSNEKKETAEQAARSKVHANKAIKECKDDLKPVREDARQAKNVTRNYDEAIVQKNTASNYTSTESSQKIEAISKRKYTEVETLISPSIDINEFVKKGLMRKQTENDIEYIT